LLQLAFWTLLGVIVWTYLGYPLVMLVRAGRQDRESDDVEAPPLLPTVSVVMAARNEEERIEARLQNLQSQGYPPELLEILLVCNGCDDNTQAIGEELARSDPRIHVLVSPPHHGKAGAINLGVQHASGHVIVFADMRQRFDNHVVEQLVAAFKDPQVGAATGQLVIAPSHRPSLSGLGKYWEWETRLRVAESRTGSVVGATGAVYAVRHELFHPLPNALILDDVWTPLSVAMRGFRVAMRTQAVAYDVPAPSQGAEFKRKCRTMAGNIQLVRANPALLSPRLNPIFLRFVSHKLLRLVTPVCLLGMLTVGVILDGAFYRVVVVGQLALMALGGLGLLVPISLLSVPSAFLLVNAAAITALLRPRASAADVWTH
jgi:cellulose synthase/poly-beta-1,6-N-acetylglucosamine synthase-like glycosyltransferase